TVSSYGYLRISRDAARRENSQAVTDADVAAKAYWTVVVECGIPGQTQITEHQFTRVGSKLSRARRDVDRSLSAVQVGQKRSVACVQVYLAGGDAAPRKRKNSVGSQLRAADVDRSLERLHYARGVIDIDVLRKSAGNVCI